MPPKQRPPLTHVKEKGEWGEIAFQAKALALGLSVAKPNGENQPFDFIVTTREGKMLRVQVKSAWTTMERRFVVRLKRCLGKYDCADIDIIAAYIVPWDTWYILPASAIPSCGYAHFYPHVPGSRSAMEKYRNRWSFLTGDPEDDTRDHGLTIHAAADVHRDGSDQ